MEDRLKNVEDIMKKYNDIKDSLEPKVDENLEKEIQDKKQELDREERILQAFKDELNSLDTSEMDYVQMHVTMGNYNRYIKEEQEKVNLIKKDYEEKLSQKEKIENPDLTLDQKKEKKSKTYEARDNAKKSLISEQKEIETEIEEQELEFKSIELKLKKFKHEYEEQEQSWEERDNEGKLVTVTKKVRVCTNGEEYKKLDDKLKETTDNLSSLKEAKSKCEEYLSQIDNEYKKDVEKINEVISRKEPEKEETTEKPEQNPTTPEKTEQDPIKTEEPETMKSEQEPVQPVEPMQKQPEQNPVQPVEATPKEPEQNPIKPIETTHTKPKIGNELVDVRFNAKKNSYSLVIKGEEGFYKEQNQNYNELIQSKEFDNFKAVLYTYYREAPGLSDIDPCVAYMLHQADKTLDQNRLDNYVDALGKKDKMSDNTAIRYDLNGIVSGIYGRNYSKASSDIIMEKANNHSQMGLANLVDKSAFIKFMEKHKHIRSAFQSVAGIGNKRDKALENKKVEKLAPAQDDKQKEDEKLKEKDIQKYMSTVMENKIGLAKNKEDLQKIREENQKLYDEGRILKDDYEQIDFDIRARAGELEEEKNPPKQNGKYQVINPVIKEEPIEPEKKSFRDKYKIDLGNIVATASYKRKVRKENKERGIKNVYTSGGLKSKIKSAIEKRNRKSKENER